MTGWRLWTAVASGVAAPAGLGVLLLVNGLDRADKLASVISAFAGLIGLVFTAWSFLPSKATARVRNSGAATASGPRSRAVSGVIGGGDVRDTGPAKATDGGHAVTGVDES